MTADAGGGRISSFYFSFLFCLWHWQPEIGTGNRAQSSLLDFPAIWLRFRPQSRPPQQSANQSSFRLPARPSTNYRPDQSPVASYTDVKRHLDYANMGRPGKHCPPIISVMIWCKQDTEILHIAQRSLCEQIYANVLTKVT